MEKELKAKTGKSSTTKSISGTISTDHKSSKKYTKPVSKKDIIGIIQQCSNFGVKEIHLEGLTLKFYPKDPNAAVQSVRKQSRKPQKMEVETELTEDARHAHLAITDPSAYEQHVMDQHLRESRS